MRNTLLAGVVLAVAAFLLVTVSKAFDLGVESVALLGAALGAVVALVPDRTPLARLAGFLGGFVVAWLGYIARAALLPDSTSGRALAVAVVVLLCVALAAATRGRLPLWSALLGTAALAGAYEFSFAAAPPEVLSTSVSSASTLLFTAGVGFLVAALIAPGAAAGEPVTRAPRPTTDGDEAPLDDLMMEKTK
jgi:hypothetical protein